jgi:hypothetical protein
LSQITRALSPRAGAAVVEEEEPSFSRQLAGDVAQRCRLGQVHLREEAEGCRPCQQLPDVWTVPGATTHGDGIGVGRNGAHGPGFAFGQVRCTTDARRADRGLAAPLDRLEPDGRVHHAQQQLDARLVEVFVEDLFGGGDVGEHVCLSGTQSCRVRD